MEAAHRERHRLALPQGYQLGSYRFDQQLGFGSFGITYLAYDTMLSRKVAIKELLPTMIATRLDTVRVEPHTADDDEQWLWAQERFVAEAQALAQCEHPNVLHVFEAFRANGTAYMVTQYEEGCTLTQWLKKLGRRPNERELRNLLDPLLAALQTVHSHTFLHRDIKPDNIYMASGDRPILIDFGSARQDVTNRSVPMTAIVTEGYAPFEQYTESGNQGPWTDLYALAAVMYAAIVGKKPPSAAERATADLDPIVNLSRSYAGEYSAALLQSIDAGLRPSARARPQTTAEWQRILSGSISIRPEDTHTPTGFPRPYPMPPEPIVAAPIPLRPAQPSSGAFNRVLLIVLVVLAAAVVVLLMEIRNKDGGLSRLFTRQEDAGSTNGGKSDAQREPLRQRLRAASQLEKKEEWDQAEAEYRAVMRDGGSWAEPRNALAGLLSSRGVAIDPAAGNAKLREAVNLCRDTLAANPRTAEPRSWAATQGSLGAALRLQGERADEAEGQRLFGDAVAACRSALEVQKRSQWPLDWARAQTNLGHALWAQSTRADGTEGTRLLGEAVTAYRAALEVQTRAQAPEDWAKTQVGLGLALYNQGWRASGAESGRLLGEAVTAYRAALGVQTREQSPLEWALTQRNLGLALVEQGKRATETEGLRPLSEAVTAYRAALAARTREQGPQVWASTQNSLAFALLEQGRRTSGAERPQLLGEAVTAGRAALKVYSREEAPHAWADTQWNLGATLLEQGRSVEGSDARRLLDESVTASRAALEIHTRSRAPSAWKSIESNVATALRAQADRVSGSEAKRLRAEAQDLDTELAAQA